jgi:hypothetical protein
MAKLQEAKKNNTKFRLRSASKDLIILALITIFIFILSYFFKAFIFLVEFFQKHPQSITWIDEIITGLLTLSIALAIFSWRRWLELKKETAERIKKQEELIRVTETRAEVERIISNQLRTDIDEIKKAAHEILRLLINKHKGAV